MNEVLPKKQVMGIALSLGTFDEHVMSIAALGKAHSSSYVCCVNVHMCVTAHREPDFASIVNEADLATADGMPMLKSLNRFNGLDQERVAGNDLMPAVMAEAERQGLGVFFYGGEEQVLKEIIVRATAEFPNLVISGAHSPPFRALAEEEWEEDVQRIAKSGASIVMVSLGCPRQERWMASMKGRVPAVMLGVGGAFLLYAGRDRRAPQWMRDASLEWLYRFSLEPGRLWKRYLTTNSIFLWMYAKQYLARHRAKAR